MEPDRRPSALRRLGAALARARAWVRRGVRALQGRLWPLAAAGLVVAGLTAFAGGLLAGFNRPLSDLVVVGAFFLAIASTVLAVLALPAAVDAPDPSAPSGAPR